MAKKNADGTPKRTRTARQGEKFTVWRKAASSAAANAAELPQAELTRVALDSVIVEVDQILLDQGAFQASKQLTSQRLQTLIDRGDKLTTVLKAIIKQHYGSGSDKLVEFGIKPFRGRPKPTVVSPTAPAPEPGTPGPAPITTQLDSK